MQLERHGWDIHALSSEPDQGGGRERRSQESRRSTGASTDAARARQAPVINVRVASLMLLRPTRLRTKAW